MTREKVSYHSKEAAVESLGYLSNGRWKVWVGLGGGEWQTNTIITASECD
jgi:hypothetical protein